MAYSEISKPSNISYSGNGLWVESFYPWLDDAPWQIDNYGKPSTPSYNSMSRPISVFSATVDDLPNTVNYLLGTIDDLSVKYETDNYTRL